MAFDVLKDIFLPQGKESPTREKIKSKGLETAGGLIGTAIATRQTEADKYNQERLAALQRRQELGMLGLTDQERAMLEAQYGGQLGQIGAEGEARRRQQMAAYDVFGGAALQQAALSDAALADAQVKATAAITEADIARRAQQEAEIQNRMELEGQRQMAKQKAYGEVIGGAIGQFSTLPSEKREEEGKVDPILLNKVKEKFGFQSDKEALDFIAETNKNPKLSGLLGGVL